MAVELFESRLHVSDKKIDNANRLLGAFRQLSNVVGVQNVLEVRMCLNSVMQDQGFDGIELPATLSPLHREAVPRGISTILVHDIDESRNIAGQLYVGVSKEDQENVRWALGGKKAFGDIEDLGCYVNLPVLGQRVNEGNYKLTAAQIVTNDTEATNELFLPEFERYTYADVTDGKITVAALTNYFAGLRNTSKL